MTTRSLIINPDGTCERRETDAATTARAVFGDISLDVNRVRHPAFIGGTYVLFIDDWGAVKELPMNIKAWALYGGSPIFGEAVLGDDTRDVIGDSLLDLIESDVFPDVIIKAQMRAFLTKDGRVDDIPAG